MCENKYRLSREFQLSSKQTFHKLLKDEEFVDVTLVCDDEIQIKAHKVILGAGSLFFAKLFRKNPHQHPLVYMFGFKWTELESIIEFLYLGEASVPEKNLKQFLNISEKLEIVGMESSAQEPNLGTQDSNKCNQINKEQPRKTKTPDIIPKLPEKEFVEETIKDKLPGLEHVNVNPPKKKAESPKNMDQTPTAAVYGYYTSANVNKQISQKESLAKLTESFNQYERQKGGQSRNNLEKARHERVYQRFGGSEKFNCEQCRYQAVSREDFRVHRLSFHSTRQIKVPF